MDHPPPRDGVRRDILWLLAVVTLVAGAVAYTPYEFALPRPADIPATPVEPGWKETYAPRSRPETFSFYCTGSRHAKAYTGFKGRTDFPQYSAEAGLLEHP